MRCAAVVQNSGVSRVRSASIAGTSMKRGETGWAWLRPKAPGRPRQDREHEASGHVYAVNRTTTTTSAKHGMLDTSRARTLHGNPTPTATEIPATTRSARVLLTPARAERRATPKRVGKERRTRYSDIENALTQRQTCRRPDPPSGLFMQC